MKGCFKRWQSLLFVLGLGCFACSNQINQSVEVPEPDVIIQDIVSVYDADTFRAALKGWPDYLGKDVGIRVRGVDAPEIRGQCAKEKRDAKIARDYVRQLLASARAVTLVNVETGKYFRLVADVYLDGKPLADDLIEHGYARAYDGGRRMGWCS